MSDEPYFGPGTTGKGVAEAIERAKSERNRDRPRPTTAERDAFFGNIAELRKKAEAS